MREIPPGPPSGVALFDMDGTLLAWDCQLLFRFHVLRREPWRYVFVPIFLLFVPLAKLLGDEGMKRVFLSFLWKMPDVDLARHSREFAAELLPSIYLELREALEKHRQAGHFTILSSASPECYAAEVGRLLGFDLSLGTVLENRSLFPDLENHKGARKVDRLRKILPVSYFDNGRLARSHGYTDSTADLPMLAVCEKATVVNPSSRLAALAEENGWVIVRPARVWKSKLDKGLRLLALLLGVGGNPAGL